MPIRLFRTFINTNVIEETLTKRATPLGIEEQSGIKEMGRAVPVVFGTRRIDGAVVYWQGVETNSRLVSPKYYDKDGIFAASLNEVDWDNRNLYSRYLQLRARKLPLKDGTKVLGDELDDPVTEKRDFTRCYVVTVRMILCVGPLDDIKFWLSNNQEFRCNQMPRQVTQAASLLFWLGATPYSTVNPSTPNNTILADPNWHEGVRRYVVAPDAGNMFGINGGLGFPFIKEKNRVTSGPFDLGMIEGPSNLLTKRRYFSEFYMVDGRTPEQSVGTNQPIAAPYFRAEEGSVSSGVTSLVFGNFIWGGLAQLPRWRMAVQRVHKQTDYSDQWYPEKVVVQRGPILEKIYLIFTIAYDQIIYPAAVAAIRRMVKDFQRLGPAGENPLTVQIAIIWGTTIAAVSRSGYITTSAELETYLARQTRTLGTLTTVNPLIAIGTMFEFQKARSRHNDNYYGGMHTNELRFGQGVQAPTRLREHVGAFLFWSNARSSSTHLESAKAWFENLSVGAGVPDRRSPAGIHSGFPEWIADIRSIYTDTPNSRYAKEIAETLDQPGQPKVLAKDESPYDFMLSSAPTFTTMNPVHALREALINKDWGAGVDERKLDDAGFRQAADTCQAEKLSYCYVWDKLDPPDRFIQEILDYIDAMMYFDQLNNLWRLKLIRNDYDISSLPLFNQTNISELARYKRQHSDQTVNSVTIKFFNILTDTEDAITVHDLGRTSVAGNVVSVVQEHPGCPLREAAAIVANREFFALSKPLVSFDLVVETSAAEHLGPGDAIRVQWVDLFANILVMRIMSVDYGDGKTGTITLRCIRDTFADPQDLPATIGVDETTGDISGAPTLIPDPIPPTDFAGDLFFQEGHYTDALGTFPDAASLDAEIAARGSG